MQRIPLTPVPLLHKLHEIRCQLDLLECLNELVQFKFFVPLAKLEVALRGTVEFGLLLAHGFARRHFCVCYLNVYRARVMVPLLHFVSKLDRLGRHVCFVVHQHVYMLDVQFAKFEVKHFHHFFKV